AIREITNADWHTRNVQRDGEPNLLMDPAAGMRLRRDDWHEDMGMADSCLDLLRKALPRSEIGVESRSEANVGQLVSKRLANRKILVRVTDEDPEGRGHEHDRLDSGAAKILDESKPDPSPTLPPSHRRDSGAISAN